MASAEEYVSAESLAQVSNDSFAQNLSNYRSLLLKYEREVESGGADDTRARLLFREAAMLQEIVEGQMRSRGRDLGVPPSAVQEVADIYQRAFAKLLFRVVEDTHLTDPNVTHLIQKVEASVNAPTELLEMVQKVKLARTAYQSVLLTPAAASIVAPSLVRLLEDIGGVARYIQDQLPPTAPPTIPPAPPTGPIGGGGDGDIPRRVERLENKMEKMAGDLSSINGTLARMEEFLKHAAMKPDIARVEEKLAPLATKEGVAGLKGDLAKVEERVSHMPTKAQMYVAGGTALAAVLGVISKGFGWL